MRFKFPTAMGKSMTMTLSRDRKRLCLEREKGGKDKVKISL